MDLIKIGEKIKQLREKSGLTQSNIAQYLSVDQSMVAKIEKGERNISLYVLEKLSTLFCCPLKDVLNKNELTPNLTISFRAKETTPEDLESLSVINKIVLNQFEMDEINKETQDEQDRTER